MTKKNSTKKALITSALCLLLCVSMLVGATFAWFTDSVSSAKNTIVAGNLDVELEYAKVVNGTMTDWATVEGAANIFDPNALWEPGRVEVVYLKVSNLGTLALKYQLGVNVYGETAGTNVAGQSFKLSNYLVFKTLLINESEVGTYTREWVANAYGAADMGLKDYNGENTAMEAGDVHYVALIVYMPETVGNEANYRGDAVPTIELGVNLYATQYTYEEDSFGPDYDENAWLNEADVAWYDPALTTYELDTPAELAGLAALVNEGTSFAGKTVVLAADIDLNGMGWTPIGTSASPFKGTFDGNGYTVSNLKVNGGKNSNIGLFGQTTDGEIKNLTVENAIVSGRLNVGVVAGTPYTSKYTNITVKGHVEVSGMAYVGGVAGKNAYANWTDITVEVDETSYVKANSIENGNAYRTYVGGVIGFMGEGGHKVANVNSNIDVYGSTCDVGGIVGIAHYGNTFENITCTGNVTITDATEADEAEEMGGIAGVWHNGGADVTFTDCVFTGNLTANFTEGVNLADNTITGKSYNTTGTGKVNINGTVLMNKATDIDAALLNGEDVNLSTNATVKTSETAAHNGYGKTGLQVKAGVTLNGNGHTLTVSGAGSTWDSAVTANGGTIKNITIASGFRGIFITATTEKVTLENVTIQGPTYTISCDSANGHGLEAINCTFNGWTSFAAAIGTAKFVDCSFGAGAGYNFSRPYAPTTYVGCDFAAGHKIDARAAITFENCTINGEPLTAENLATLVTGNIANATVIG